MQMRRISLTYASFAGLLGLMACGGDEPKAKAPSTSVGDQPDAGPRSAGADASMGGTGGFDNTVEDEGKVLCGYADEDVIALPGNLDLPLASIARSPAGFGLLFYDEEGNLRIQAANRSGYTDEAVPVGTAFDGLKQAQVAASGDAYLLATRAEEDGSMVLRTRSLTGGTGADTIHTAALAEGAGGGELWDLAGDTLGYLLAYLDDATLHLKRLGRDGEVRGTEATFDAVAERTPASLQVVEVDDDAVLVAWAEPQEDGSYVVMGQHFNSSLATVGDVVQLSKTPISDPRFDFSARALSAGLIYQNKDADVRETIRYRRVEPDGSVPGPVLSIVGAPRKATDGAIADFGQGYVIAYRTLASLGAPTPEVRAAFINQFGAVVYEVKLADSSELGGPVSVNSTSDGHILVTWTSSNGFEAERTAVKMNCPGALLLCGGELE